MWIQTKLSCGKYSTTMQIRIVSRLWFCRRSRRLKINIRWSLVHFRKSHVRASKLDISFTQFHRSWNNFFRCRFTHGWNSSSWSLGFCYRSVSFFPKPTQQHQTVKYRETCRVIPHQTSRPKTKPRFQPSTTTLIWTILTVSRRTRSFLDLVRCCTSLRISQPLLKWSSKAEVQQWDMYREPTELLLIGCLTELVWTPKFKSSMSTPNTNLQTYWQKGISHAMSGTIFFICLTSAISAFSAALRISAWPAAPKRWRKGCKSRKKRTESWQSQKRRWTWSHCLDKFFDCAEYDCVEKPGDTQSTLSNSLVNYRETWRKRSQSRRSVEFSRMAKRCTSGH